MGILAVETIMDLAVQELFPARTLRLDDYKET